jgi:hypothetical protein
MRLWKDIHHHVMHALSESVSIALFVNVQLQIWSAVRLHFSVPCNASFPWKAQVEASSGFTTNDKRWPRYQNLLELITDRDEPGPADCVIPNFWGVADCQDVILTGC